MAAKRPKLKEVADVAGVSKATVDRVVNLRPGVQEHTRQHVMATIAMLTGIETSSESTSPEQQYRLDFVIPDNGNGYMDNLVAQLHRHAEARRGVILGVHRLDGIAPDRLVSTLNGLQGRTDGVGLIGLDRPDIRDAVRALVEAEVPVVTMASDIRNVPRWDFVGIDNHAAGRLAGFLTGRLSGPGNGTVALILGSRAYLGHQEREMGFRAVLRESFTDLTIIAEREINEDTERAYRTVRDLLAKQPDLTAIYCIGAGQPGIARAIEESGQSVIFVGHGLTRETRQFLLDGVMDVVIDESTQLEAEYAIDQLIDAIAGERGNARPSIRIEAVFRENLPLEL